jgi:hypothetical protein
MPRLLFGLLTAALLATSSVAQDLDKKVTLSARAADATHVLQQLSDASGVALEAAPLMAKDILAIKVKDVPLKEVMDRIATATGGEWKPVGQAYRLERSEEQYRKDVAADRAARLAAFQKSLGRLLKGVSTGVTDRASADKLAQEMQAQIELEMSNTANRNPDIWKKREQLQYRTPVSMMSARLLSAIDPAILLDIPEDTRIVFSTTPTRMQRPLGPAAFRAAQQFIREQALWAEAVRRLPYKPHEGYDEDGSGLPVGFYGVNKPKGTPVKVLLVVNRSQRGGMGLDMMVVDDKGRVMFRNGFAASFEEADYENYQRIEKLAQAEPKEAKLEVSPMTKRIVESIEARMNSFQGGGGATVDLPADVREFLLYPEKNDPLSTFATDFVFGYADSKKVNIVALLHDDMVMLPMFMGRSQEVGVNGLKLFAETFAKVDFNEAQPGWAVLRPRNPVTARGEQTDRLLMGKIVRRFAAGRPSLDELAEIAQTAPNPFNDQMTGYSMMLLTDMGYMWEATNWDLLRFYGSLSRGQRNMLRQGGKIQLGQLGPNQRNNLNRLIFYTQTNLGLETGDEMAAPTGIEDDAVEIPAQTAEDEMSYGDIRTEPTEALPNGLPPTGLLNFTVTNRPVISSATGPIWLSRGMAPEEIASMMLMKEHPEMAGGDTSAYLDFKTLKLGSREELGIRVRFDAELVYQDMLISTNMDPKVLTFAQLPKDVREAIDKAKKEMEAAMKGQDQIPVPDRSVGGPPPPVR